MAYNVHNTPHLHEMNIASVAPLSLAFVCFGARHLPLWEAETQVAWTYMLLGHESVPFCVHARNKQQGNMHEVSWHINLP